MKVLFLSHTAAGGVFDVGSHNLTRELATAGHEVTHVATPVSLPARARPGASVNAQIRRDLGRTATAPGWTQLIPWSLAPQGRGLLPRLDARLVARQVRAARPHVPRWDVTVVDQPTFVDVLALLPHGTVVYRPTDIQHLDFLARCEQAIAPLADAVVTTNAHVYSRLPDRFHALPYLELRNGVDLAQFRTPDPGPRTDTAVYVGALDERFDWAPVAAFARALPTWAVDVYGPPPATPPGPLPGNVRLRGPVPHPDVPAVLRAAKVGLMPFVDSPRNAGRSPMKLFEYRAAGLWVVATGNVVAAVPDVEGLLTFDDVTSDPAAAATRTATPYRMDAAEADREDWPHKARQLLEFVEQVHA